MFKSARLKLTVWYLTIIMVITFTFSMFVFVGVDITTKRALEAQSRRLERQLNNQSLPRPSRFGPMIDAETLLDIRQKTIRNLVLMNTVVFLVSGSLGYFLAGKTLKPIEEMVTKQKRFISDAAHEIKTPLTAIKTTVEVALRDKNLSVEDTKQTLKSVVEDVDKLSSLTNKLIEQSRFQLAKNIKLDNLNLKEVIETAVKELKPILGKKEQQIVTSLSSLFINGNREELTTLVVNIIENSSKYSSNRSEIEVNLEKQKDMALIMVKDHGMGIEKENIKQLFEPFYRVEKSRKDGTVNGYGLGLTIAKEIVNRHHGYIEIESEIHKGTQVSIKFPLSKISE